MTDAEFAAEWDAAIAEIRVALLELADRIRPATEWITERLPRRHPQTETFCPIHTREFPFYGEWAIVSRGFIDRTPRCSRCGAPAHPIVRLTPKGRAAT